MGDKTRLPFQNSTRVFEGGAPILQKDPKIIYWVQRACVYYKCFYYGHFILPLNILFYLCTEKINFTQGNYELIKITSHQYDWCSVFWTGDTERYKWVQQTWLFLFKIWSLAFCAYFFVLSEIYIACEIICHSFGSERFSPWKSLVLCLYS